MKKAFKIITDVLLLIAVLLVAVMYVPGVAGIRPYAVLSGSMEPAYHVGSVVYVKNVQPETIEVGDAITFHITEDTLVTHRVVEKDSTSQTFKTKGDANENEDGGAVSYNSLVGKVIFNVPMLGYISSYMATKSGMIITVTVVIVLLILTFLPDFLKDDEKNEKEDQKKPQEKEDKE